MPESETRFHANGTKTLKFMQTPIMSTYLLAYVIGEFDMVQCVTNNGVSIRVFVPLGEADQAPFSMDVAKRCLDFYDDYFQVPYPLPKLDMVAMPEFAAGAMENWGLVTYRQVDLMIDSSKATVSQLQRVASVVTHELAHQWFGNLVTMQWWDDLWLNEGFACWMQTFSADALFPQWNLWDQFCISDQSAALRLDALRSSHPIQVPIKHAEEVEQVFDAISYCKGACVIRMIHEVVGAKAFKAGLQNYLSKHSHGNTETTDLWNAWSESSGKPVSELMSTWTQQMGYPVLKVHSMKVDSGKVKLDVSQDWFLADGSSVEGDASVTWTVPVVVRWQGMTGDSYQHLMTGKREEITLDGCVGNGWVKLNAGQHVLTRVVYTSDMLQALAKAVKKQELRPEDRAALILDALQCSKAGHVDVGEVVKLLGAYDSEMDDTVWSALAQVLGGLGSVLVEEPEIYAKFEALAANMVLPAFKKLGWDDKADDSDVTKSLRGTLIGLVGKYSSQTPEVIAEARNRFARLMESPKDTTILAPESKIPAFQMVLKAGGEAEYNQLLAYYHLNSGDIAEQKLVFSSLGYTSDKSMKVWLFVPARTHFLYRNAH
jgi:puromycin-sensitive aminopeptidase